MTSSYPANLATYFADDEGKQVIEIKPATIDIVTEAYTEPNPTSGFQVLYSIYLTTPFQTGGSDDYSVSGLEFTLDFSEGSYQNLLFGEPSLAGFLPQEIPNVGTYYSIPANERIFSEFALTDGLTTFSSSAEDQYYVNFVSTSADVAFPFREQAFELPVFDFAPEQGITGFGPIGLIPGPSLPSGVAARVVEYSDSGNHSSLIEVSPNGAGHIVNSIDSTDEDYVAFKVPQGVVIENFVLESYIGDETTDTVTDVGSISIAKGLLYDESAEVLNAIFGDSTDSNVFGVGDNLLGNTTLDEGLYIAKITHTGGSNSDRGYQFAFGPGLEIDLSIFAAPFVFDEGTAITIDLPQSSSADSPLPLTWSLSSVIDSNSEAMSNNLIIDYQTLSGFLDDEDFNGPLTLNLTATDGDASKSIPIQIAIDPVNDAPIILDGITLAEQTTSEDQLYEFTVPASAFADIDGDEVILEASLIDGVLPNWLSFNSITGVFSGTPSNEDVGSLDIQVTASDPDGESATDTFALTITNTNDQPISEAIEDQAAVEDSVFQFTVPENTFSDVDEGDLINLTASLADGSSLPAWLNFLDGVFTGTPDNEQVGNIDLKVTATDLSGDSVSEPFTINVANTNDSPTISSNIQSVSATEDTPYTITFDELLTITGAADIDAGDTLEFHINPYPIIESGGSLSVLRNDENPWYELNGATLLRENESLQLIPPIDFNGVLDSFLIMATDQDGVDSTSHILQFDLEATDDAPQIEGSSNLSDQLFENDSWASTFEYLEVDLDNVSWSIAATPEGPDDTGSFSIDSDGTLSFTGNADFESGKETYSVLVKLSDQDTADALSSDNSGTSKLVSLQVLDRPDQTLDLGVVNQYVPGDGQIELSLSYHQEQWDNPANRFGFEIKFDNHLDLSIDSSFFDRFNNFEWDNEGEIGTFSIDGSTSTAVLNRDLELLVVNFEDAASLSQFMENEGSLIFDVSQDVVHPYGPYVLEWDYLFVDTDSGFDDQGPDTQDFTIEADPYQVITAAPSSPYIPGDNAVRIDISYIQSNSLANDFSFTVNYDAQALTWSADSAVTDSLFDIDASKAGEVTFTTTQSELIPHDLGGNLEFTINDPENETGPFNFDFTQANELEYGYVQRDPFALTVSPSPDDFNHQDFLDLSVFLNDKLSLNLRDRNLADENQSEIISPPLALELAEKNISLEFSKSFDSIVLSQNDDTLALPSSSIDFHLGNGDDTLFQPLSSTFLGIDSVLSSPSSGLLGRGNDELDLLSYDYAEGFSYRTNILDFEIGHDFITIGQLGDFQSFEDVEEITPTHLHSRHDILNILPEVLQTTSFDISFAPLIEAHFELDNSFDRVFLSNTSPILSPELLIEPGTINNGDFLNLNILTNELDNSTGFNILGVDSGVTELVEGEWTLKVDGANAKIVYSGIDLSSSNVKLISTSSYKDFLGLSRRLIVDSSSYTPFDVEASWNHNLDVALLDQQYADNAANLAPRSSDVLLSDLLGVSEDNQSLLVTPINSGDFADRLKPIALDVVAPLKKGIPTIIRGTDSDDSISLLGDVVQQLHLNPSLQRGHINSGASATAYGRGGHDYLIGKDGSRLVGGSDTDYLASQLGSGTTQLVGGDDDDILIGGDNDVLIGGRGDDDIVLRGLGARVFTGSGMDSIHIDTASFGSLHGGRGLTRVLDFSSDDTIIINMPELTKEHLTVEKRSTGVMIRVADHASWAKEILGADNLMLIQGAVNPQSVLDNLYVHSVQPLFEDPLLAAINPGTVGTPMLSNVPDLI